MNWRPMLWSLGGSAAFLLFCWALRSAEGAGLVGGEVVQRTIQAVVGLGLAVYGNFMPKIIDYCVSPSLRAAAFHQGVARVGGWSMTLAGLIYATLWVFTPLPFAGVASKAVVLTSVAIMLGYAAWAIATCRRAPSA